MDLNLSDEQRLLRESAERFVAESYDADHRRKMANDPLGFSPAVWTQFAELGWLALPIPEQFDGLGGGAVEIGILMEAFGRGLVSEPYVATVVLGAALIDRCGSTAQKQASLPKIADGSLKLALAHSERAARFDLAKVATAANKTAQGWRLAGSKIAVLDGHAADEIIVSAHIHDHRGPSGRIGLFLVPATAPGLSISDYPRLGGGRACNIELPDVHLPEDALLGDGKDALPAIEWAVDRAMAALGAEAVGIMQMLLETTLEYTKIRKQFGRPLSANQVIRHRLADMAMQVDEARSMALRAPLCPPRPAWPHRRIGLNRKERIMDLSFNAEERAFQDEVRGFIAKNLTEEMKRATALTPSVFSDPDIGMAWQRALHRQGWGAPGWPVEYGGPDWTPAQRWIFETESARAGVPNVNVMGVKMVGPVIIGFGSPEQKNFYLPRILSGEDYWCQGYSEPGSGSDLSSLKTRAVRDGDHYIINGTKIWTTHAHHANRMFALVRTSDGPRQQDGISFILIDMKTPGITTRPILTIGGDHEVNQVFFDDVRVPMANRVGEEGKGWTYGKYLLEFERGSGIASAKLREGLKAIADLAESDLTGRAIDSPDIATRISEVEVDIDALEMTELRVLSALQTGQNPGAVSSILKLRNSEIRQAVTRLGADVIGHDALAVEPMRPLYKLNHEPAIPEDMLTVVPEYLNGRAYTIFGGTSEIQRDIIAKMMLGI
ncbi:alkylation response protein AidB-like acyl-CoA dehydrogenase [Bradyrhizobium diazoefficiens]